VKRAGFQRQSVLLGALGGLIFGIAAGFGVAGAAAPRASAGVPSHLSYAQQGEDLILENVFEFLAIAHPTYIDIGAFDPISGNNTYRFYQAGSRGVLVEPNPALLPKLRRARPNDTVLEIGIGARAEDEEADYYLIAGDGQLNTFSKEELDRLQVSMRGNALTGIVKRKLVNINKVLAQYFPKTAPDLFSTDTEGYDLTILRSLDFERFRPRVFCVETLHGLSIDPEIADLMGSKDYDLRAGTFVNTIFVDRRYVRDLASQLAARARTATAGEAGVGSGPH
jgi:FkbM family methyltransferase